jgi:hypothetical protein
VLPELYRELRPPCPLGNQPSGHKQRWVRHKTNRSNRFKQKERKRLLRKINLSVDQSQCDGHNGRVPQEERALIDAVERRLVQKYAALPPDDVAAVVRQAYAQFKQSAVRDFIPLLVERRASEELTSLAGAVMRRLA